MFEKLTAGQRLSPHEIRALAVDAAVCPATVRRWLNDPLSVRSTCAARLAAALQNRRFNPPPGAPAALSHREPLR